MRLVRCGALLAVVAILLLLLPSAHASDSARPPASRDIVHSAPAGMTALQSRPLASNHALIITISQYPVRPLPGVLKDREIARILALRIGVPTENIEYLSEADVTRDGLRRKFAEISGKIAPGDRLYIHYSGHGGRRLEPSTGQCVEGLISHDLELLTKDELAVMLRELAAKLDKTIFIIDACHSGGIVDAMGTKSLATRNLKGSAMTPKFLAPKGEPDNCAKASNFRSLDAGHPADFNMTSNNLAILSAARPDEVAWDTENGGALSYNMLQCFNGGVSDDDHTGAVALSQLQSCVQKKLDSSQEEGRRQHPKSTGNGDLVVAFNQAPPPAAETPDTLAVLRNIYGQRDDRWGVKVTLAKPVLRIGVDDLDLEVTSSNDGFVYVFYRGSQPGSFFLLFPNQLDQQNGIKAGEVLRLPRPDWQIPALGPSGVDNLLVMVTQNARDFSALNLPPDYVSQAGPFSKFTPSRQASQKVTEAATLSASLKDAVCQKSKNRDLGVALRCSNVFGAELVNIEERE